VRERLKAAPDVEGVGERLLFLRILQKKIAQKTLARCSRAKNKGVSHLALAFVYLMWFIVLVVLYFPCRWFEKSKASTKRLVVKLSVNRERL
jgi:hypothetical protein